MSKGWKEGLLQAILQNAGIGLMVQDCQRRIVFLNRACEEITGWSWEEVGGKECSVVFGCRTSTGKCLLNKFCPGVRVIEEEAPRVSREVLVNLGSGGERWVEVTVAPIKNEKGRVEYIVSIFQDISEKKRYSQELLRTKTLATLGQLASELAHEVKNPLNAIQIQMLLLERETARGKELSQGQLPETIARVKEEITRLNSLVEGCLRFSRSSHLNLRYENLRPILEELVGLVGPQAGLGGVNINLEIEEGLPLVMADREKLKQALLNIVLNACEAMPDGGVLHLRAIREANTVRIITRDTGGGIPEEARDRVFELFYTTKKGGTGIGLPMSQNIAQAHGGYITFSSSKEGTEFVMTLPLGL